MSPFPHLRSIPAVLTILGATAGPAVAGLSAPPVIGPDSGMVATTAQPLRIRPAVDPLTGPRSHLPKDWIGLRALPPDTPILVMAGHADSQNLKGSGTAGAAVGLGGSAPMMPGISDELYWNLVVAGEVVRIGRQRGLVIRYHSPPSRTMHDHESPGTNWTEGRRHADAGGYALEIHFDAYGPDGVGSGLIPAAVRPFTRIDESLAEEFGAYPMQFRNVLGGPRRGISLLEVGKLEGRLEASLRDPRTRAATVATIADRVVSALERGLGRGDRFRPGTAALR